MSTPKVYLAGPMTGYPEFNFPAFFEAEKRWTDKKYEVLNPARTDNGDTTKEHKYYMRRDIEMLLDADAVAFLPGWQNSKGATVEYVVAQAISLPMFDAITGKPLSENVLQEANRVINGPRDKDYGHPRNDFAKTAAFWSTLFRVEVSPEQVALAMILLKVSREMNRPKRDNIVDIAGYAGTIEKLWEPVEDGRS